MSEKDPALESCIARFMNRQLKVADHAMSCLGQKESAEALHDFRVAIRRVRTYLHLHQGEIKGTRSLQRKLRKLMHASDEARDAEVWLALLDVLAEGSRRQEYEGIASIRKRLSNHLEEARVQAQSAIDEKYPPLRHDLRSLTKELAHAHTAKTGKRNVLPEKQLSDLWCRLDAKFCSLLPDMDPVLAHRARLYTKRLRYFLESERDQLPTNDLDEVFFLLKSIQTLLGEWRDAMLFGDWLTEAAAACCGGQARQMIRAALHDDVHGFAVLQAHELLSGLVYLATRLSAHLESYRKHLVVWLEGSEHNKLQAYFNQSMTSPSNR